MTCEEFKKEYLKGIILIDLRSPKDYLEGHIPNSINIPHTELIINHKQYLNSKDKYYLICDEGIVSKNVIHMLTNYKYKLINITDGFNAWDGPVVSN